MIPKANGKMRGLGIPCLRDKIVQEAIRMALEPIFEVAGGRSTMVVSVAACPHAGAPTGAPCFSKSARNKMISNDPLYMLALTLGIEPANGCECCVCGDSAFRATGSLGVNFADHDILRRPDLQDVCEGCARILGGRPGDDPPPLRTVSVLCADRTLAVLDRPAMWAVLCEPPSGEFVLSWTASRKKHHALRAGISTSDRMLIGGDDGTIDYVPPRDAGLLDAVHSLRSGPPKAPAFTIESIRTGHYSASAIASFGASRHAAAELIIQPYRYGRPDLLALVLWCCPIDPPKDPGDDDMHDPTDETAAELLGCIARGSEMRIEDGLAFWRGVYEHRVRRFARLPMPAMVSRLMTEVATTPSSEAAQRAVQMLGDMDDDQQAAVSRAIRERTTLVLALAFGHRSKARCRPST